MIFVGICVSRVVVHKLQILNPSFLQIEVKIGGNWPNMESVCERCVPPSPSKIVIDLMNVQHNLCT